MKKKERNINLDLIRSMAVFSVISVHFFMNNGYYETNITGERMILMTYIRTFFMICVPLFLLLTGYLMNKKKLDFKYYFGIKKILVIYILASICCLAYRIVHLDQAFSFVSLIKSMINFSGAPYAWYIDMYIGLFLIIPFLNLVYWNIDDRKQKNILLITFLLLSVVPLWWKFLYPITYYFLGAYLAEYNIKISKIKNILMILLSVTVFGTINILVSHDKLFVWGNFNDWGSFQNIITSSLVFIFLLNLNTQKLPQLVKKIIIKVSELSLGIYLLSFIFDNYFYQILNAKEPIMQLRLEWYFVIVPVVFIFSMFLAQILEWITNLILLIADKVAIKIRELVTKKVAADKYEQK